MLSYQHTYHAGCYADVIKHVALCNILSYMTQKEKPLFYLDTHASRGLYDLHDKQAMKNQEFLSGISILWAARDQLPSEFTPYLHAIRQWNPDDNLRYYPGSPAFALQGLRTQDRLFLCEQHPTEFSHLQTFTKRYPRVHCENKDGYHELIARLPPPERRGLIMIDPTYEVKKEYRTVVQKCQAAHRLFATGTYCIWYPILDKKLHQQLVQGFAAIPHNEHLLVEFYLNSKLPVGMDACGLCIINPPFMLEKQLCTVLECLRTMFNPGRSTYVLKTGTHL